jgi:predicted Zn-ribbon and HTH transcriptional regulator
MKHSTYTNFQKQGKGNYRQTQLQTIFQYLQNHIATASMVTAATGVPQKCLTRYKRDLEKAGRLWEVVKTNCKETGFKAWYLTTDPSKAPNCLIQLNLF